MSDEEIINPERPTLYAKDGPLLYLADGTPLRRQMGFSMQTSQTFPQLNKPQAKKPTKGGGRKSC